MAILAVTIVLLGTFIGAAAMTQSGEE